MFSSLLLLSVSLVDAKIYGSVISGKVLCCFTFFLCLSNALSMALSNYASNVETGVVMCLCVEALRYPRMCPARHSPDGDNGTVLANASLAMALATGGFGLLMLLLSKLELGRFLRRLPLGIALGTLCSISLVHIQSVISLLRGTRNRLGALLMTFLGLASLRAVSENRRHLMIVIICIVFPGVLGAIENLLALTGEKERANKGVDHRLLLSELSHFLRLERMSKEYMLHGAFAVARMCVSCLVGALVNTAASMEHKNAGEAIDREISMQGLANIAFSPFLFPTHTSYPLTLLLDGNWHHKTYKLVSGILLVPAMLLFTAFCDFIPLICLASISMLPHINVCYFSFVSSFSHSCFCEYTAMIAVAAVGWWESALAALFFGMLLCALQVSCLYLRSLYGRDWKENAHLRERYLRPLLLKEKIDYLSVNYLLFSGSVNLFEEQFSALQSFIVVIDMDKCFFIDMYARNYLRKLIKHEQRFFVLVGCLESLSDFGHEDNLAIVGDCYAAAGLLQRMICEESCGVISCADGSVQPLQWSRKPAACGNSNAR